MAQESGGPSMAQESGGPCEAMACVAMVSLGALSPGAQQDFTLWALLLIGLHAVGPALHLPDQRGALHFVLPRGAGRALCMPVCACLCAHGLCMACHSHALPWLRSRLGTRAYISYFKCFPLCAPPTHPQGRDAH